VPVHLYGQMADMGAIQTQARDRVAAVSDQIAAFFKQPDW